MRDVIFSKEFDECVVRLGRYRAIDEALSPIIEALSHDPYGFDKVENDWTSVRFARTKPIDGISPALLVLFVIDGDRNVVLNWVEEDLDG